MTKKIGIIGGSGLYEIAELKDKKWLPKKEGHLECHQTIYFTEN